MMPDPNCPQEEKRLQTLYALDILDTPPEAILDDIASMAAGLFDVPIALVSLVDSDRQWFKACVGLEVSETPRNISFCTHAIRAEDVFVVPDAAADDRFCTNPLVIGPPHIRFYAGAQLRTPDRQNIGTLCIIDRRPRHDITIYDCMRLRRLANIVETQLALRYLSTQFMNEVADRQTLVSAFEAEREQLITRLKAKRDYLAKMAHDLRTPLNSISACADLLLRPAPGPHDQAKTHEYADIIRSAASFMTELCSTILDYAKTRSDQFSVKLEPLDLAQVVEDTAALFSTPAMQRGLMITIRIDEAPLSVNGDAIRLKQILMNLISNALKFTNEGGEITVALQRGVDGMAKLSVSDTGVGIDASEIGRALMPYAQTASAKKSRQAGTGLGLPIARQLAERHSGSLTLTSKLGIGTCVTVTLPLSDMPREQRLTA
ncbi:MAG TPA: hypothetical protein DCL54_15220 [Alphaproteobacteria bacterium]|nr:hypothetical protein [Alphaproteobacteria bacterium]HAJ47922.1 hypothetical protein [Alphaproteobacteria bacterium]